ncbi:hypothetical protein [Larsenimonas suaedae]|uniref:Cell division protein ZipA n=1 Tax=Larsenimonas suaedae TaxID=1851019 RepID=A0ABU1GTI5_9GAMM|nr:hypothetical protein [Larsenimonas suaedae]MDR5895321.1 hypothetical protein [Larsenimonas suaedae]
MDLRQALVMVLIGLCALAYSQFKSFQGKRKLRQLPEKTMADN